MNEHVKQLRCMRCSATGHVPCEICSGRGEVIVGRDSRSFPIYRQCSGCYGRKTMRCRTCSGSGFQLSRQ